MKYKLPVTLSKNNLYEGKQTWMPLGWPACLGTVIEIIFSQRFFVCKYFLTST